MLSVDFCLVCALLGAAHSQSVPVLTIHQDEPGVSVSKTLYGIFFEEINCAGDGGIYPEQIRNRSFEESDMPTFWDCSPPAAAAISYEQPLTKMSPRSLAIHCTQATRTVQLENHGYWGLCVRKSEVLNLSFFARSSGSAVISFELLDKNQGSLAEAKFEIRGPNWTRRSIDLLPKNSSNDALLKISIDSTSKTWLDLVSLIPKSGFNNREGGLRPDLCRLLQELRPSFMRFPGGCWVEGETMQTAMRWKQTIGPPELRFAQQNLWGYQSTNGLGFYEYLQLCEDIGATPLFVINCGMSHKEVVPMPQMDEYVQDALDAIEYANGPVTSRWGAIRAAAGHPKPFGLRYMEIGNENGGPAYEERYELFVKAIKAKHPEIRLIADVWAGYPKSAPVEIIDEHYYSNPDFFFRSADRYDEYSRSGPKVYVGEYAVTEGCGNGNLIGALAEAAFMTGLERNSDVVVMASYAPLFANLNKKSWNPDLIYFDNHRAVCTPSYFVQKLFATNRPDRNLKSQLSESAAVRNPFPLGSVGVGTWNTQCEYKELKVRSRAGDVLMEDETASSLSPVLGRWQQSDGAMQQLSSAAPAILIGNGKYAECDFTVKARKLGGAEGFLILLGYGGANDYVWLNLGGWGNSLHAIEWAQRGVKTIVGSRIPGRIELNRWYDIRVSYRADRIECYLDGVKLFSEAPPETKTLFTSVGLLEKSKEIIVKVVNSSDSARTIEVNLTGRAAKRFVKLETVLTSDLATDENTLEYPNKVSPKPFPKTTVGPRFSQTLRPHSLTVLRLAPSD